MIPDELYGGSIFINTSSVLTLAPFRRLWVINPSANLDFLLPDATRFNSTGGNVLQVANASLSFTLTAKDADGNTIETLSPLNSTWFSNSDNTTAAGNYRSHHKKGVFVQGAAIPKNRELYSFTFSESTREVNLHSLLLNERGWTGLNPVRLHVTIENGAIIGSDSPTTLSFQTGSPYPAGSFMYLHVRPAGVIAGKGGDGGIAGDYNATIGQRGGTPPENGGSAVGLTINTAINNEGLIGGGGGGGGAGGWAFGVENGGGGGGGAGDINGIGGAGGDISSRGTDGQLTLSGSGGTTTLTAGNGGFGGTLGNPGFTGIDGPDPFAEQSEGQPGGFAGASLQVTTGVLVHPIKFGTLLGPITFI